MQDLRSEILDRGIAMAAGSATRYVDVDLGQAASFWPLRHLWRRGRRRPRNADEEVGTLAADSPLPGGRPWPCAPGHPPGTRTTPRDRDRRSGDIRERSVAKSRG